MAHHPEVYIYSDQPATCPKCGARTEIVLDIPLTAELTQYHRCLPHDCNFEFVMQTDNETDKFAFH